MLLFDFVAAPDKGIGLEKAEYCIVINIEIWRKLVCLVWFKKTDVKECF